MEQGALTYFQQKWEESGDPYDEADLLRERIRNGELDKNAVWCAALLCYPAALIAEEKTVEQALGAAWLYALEKIDKLTAVQVTLSIVDGLLKELPEQDIALAASRLVSIARSWCSTLDPEPRLTNRIGECRALVRDLAFLDQSILCELAALLGEILQGTLTPLDGVTKVSFTLTSWEKRLPCLQDQRLVRSWVAQAAVPFLLKYK